MLIGRNHHQTRLLGSRLTPVAGWGRQVPVGPSPTRRVRAYLGGVRAHLGGSGPTPAGPGPPRRPTHLLSQRGTAPPPPTHPYPTSRVPPATRKLG
ncbi:hypothetical protein CRUP_008612 [Coryphaenoides rupestris]|nr:hypothetical protein CRUP_008612 [Coryphaenoides rupestris]